MTIKSISSVINLNFLQRIGGSVSSSSVQASASSGSESVQITLGGLSNGARLMTQAMSGLNSLISFINITKQDLVEFKKISEEMVNVVTKATRAGTGQSIRSALNVDFQELITEFKNKVSEMSGRQYDGIDQKGIEEIFSLIGFDKKTSESFSKLIESFNFQLNSDGDTVLVSDISQARRPISIPSSALQTRIRTSYANGDGTFYARDNQTVASPFNINSVNTGDVDDDGIQDIVFQNTDGTLYRGEKNADGTFRTTVSIATISGRAAYGQGKLVDLDGDGKDEFINLNSDGSSNTYLQISTGASDLISTTDTLIGTNSGNLGFDFADFDGDSNADLVYFDSTLGSVAWRAGDGLGGFGAAQAISAYSSAGGASAIKSSDVNGDGFNDVVFLQDDGFTVSLGDGAGNFATGVTYNTTINSSNAKDFILSDLDSNGSADIVVPDSTNGQLRVWVNSGTGTYSSGNAISVGIGTQSVFLRDINNDGNQDIVTLNQNERTLSSIFGNGDSTFQDRITSTLAKTPGAGIIGDFNGDGLTEVIIGNQLSAGASSFSTLDSTPTVVETTGIRGSGTDYSTLFAPRRNILSRPDAFRMLADVKALDKQIQDNIDNMDKSWQYVADNMQMIRQVGLAFISASNEVAEDSVQDPNRMISILQEKIRNGSREGLNLLENLENIVAVTLTRINSSN